MALLYQTHMIYTWESGTNELAYIWSCNLCIVSIVRMYIPWQRRGHCRHMTGTQGRAAKGYTHTALVHDGNYIRKIPRYRKRRAGQGTHARAQMLSVNVHG